MSKRTDLARRFLLPHWLEGRLRFPRERDFVESGRKTTGSNAPSLAFFTVAKSASSYTPKALRYLSGQHLDLVPLDLASYFYHYSADKVWETIRSREDELFHAEGYLYVPLRERVKLPERVRAILMLRDPRDVVTSGFFSRTRVHSLPANPERREEYLSRREKASSETIDEWSEHQGDLVARRYLEYVEMCQKHPVTVLYYEDMIADFPAWVRDLATAMGVSATAEDVTRLAQLGRFSESPSRTQHIRQRTPGEFRKRLSKDHIRVLNEKLGPALDHFGYDI